MSRILFIGDYYPLFSYVTDENFHIAKELQSAGNEVYLLSKSWCTTTKETFYGTYENLSKDYPFKKRYYLDPIEFRNFGKDLISCFVGLGCKIIECEKIESIIFSEDISYSLAVELLKKKYDLPCYLLLFDKQRFFLKALSNYVYPYIGTHLKIYDYIFTCAEYKNILEYAFGINQNIIVANPYQILNSEHREDDTDKPVYVLCNNISEPHIENICLWAEQELRDISTRIQVITSKNADLIKNTNAQINAMKSITSSRGWIIHEDEFMSNGLINFSFLFASLMDGFYPLIHNKCILSFPEREIEYKKYKNFSEIRFLKPQKQVADYFVCS